MMGFNLLRGSLMRSMANMLKGSQQKTFTASSANLGEAQHIPQRRGVKGDFVPVYVALGMIAIQLTIGAHTALHELRYSPEVHLRKSRRETLPEIEDPDTVVEEGDKFVKNSWFRKMAHVQDLDLVPRPAQEDPLTRPPRAETLKSVGIDPKSQ